LPAGEEFSSDSIRLGTPEIRQRTIGGIAERFKMRAAQRVPGTDNRRNQHKDAAQRFTHGTTVLRHVSLTAEQQRIRSHRKPDAIR